MYIYTYIYILYTQVCGKLAELRRPGQRAQAKGARERMLKTAGGKDVWGIHGITESVRLEKLENTSEILLASRLSKHRNVN